MGPVAHGPLVPHDLRSVSKSVVGLLYGIALAEGRVPAPDTPLLDAFAAHADLARDERRRAIRVADALGMSMGLAWNEDLPYNDPRNSEIAMERSADRIRYVLDRPIVAAPGTQWRYNGGTTVLLADLITRGSGLPLLRYAQDKLFTPLGITEAEWTAGPSGRRGRGNNAPPAPARRGPRTPRAGPATRRGPRPGPVARSARRHRPARAPR